MHLTEQTLPTPVGDLRLVASEFALVAVLWPHDTPDRVNLGPTADNSRHPILRAATTQLREYFAGTRTAFDLPLAPAGTPFQQSVWQALLRIPFGETRTYAALARDLGQPFATRAVGAANGRNPLSIVIPCHRVVGASGRLTGFAGGLPAKAHLLALEQSASFALTSPRP